MKEPHKKKFTLNIVVIYYGEKTPNNYRQPLHNLFMHLAWLHGLDYAIDTDTKAFDNVQPDPKTISDIIYLRSGANTKLSLREFQKVVDIVFYNSIASVFAGVDVFYQNQSSKKLYPFPNEFYRPLNYPYIELHKGIHKEMFVHKEALDFDVNLIPFPN